MAENEQNQQAAVLVEMIESALRRGDEAALAHAVALIAPLPLRPPIIKGPEMAKLRRLQIVALIQLHRVDEAESLAFAIFDRSSNPSVRLDSYITRLVMEGKPQEAVALLSQEAIRSVPPSKPGAVSGIARVAAIKRLVVDNGHPLIQYSDPDDLSAACGLPVLVADLLTEKAKNVAAPGTLIILTGHINGAESNALRALKEVVPDCVAVAWLFDNHHYYLTNAWTAAAADLCFPAHPMLVDYLSLAAPGRVGPVIPLATSQWSRPELTNLYGRFKLEKRSDVLSGHFAFYHHAHRRNALVIQAMEQLPQAQFSLVYDSHHYSLSPEERFLRWRRFKTSVCLPVVNDLPIRFFDALATGQVPIVADGILDLDRVIPPADQASLPIVRLKSYTVSALCEAHEQAIIAYDRDGDEGALRRHRYVLERHMFAQRIHKILNAAGEHLSRGSGSV